MLAAKFFERFRGLDRAHGVFNIKSKSAKNKMEGRALTQSTAPTAELWEQHLDGKQGLGIIPITDEGTCFWGAIDIDIYDNFDMWALEEKIKELNLPLILCRTKSGGAHLYLFMEEEVDAQLIRSKLMEWAIALGHPNVEVFPKQVRLASKEDCGNWLNMPYFNAKKTERFAYREKKVLTADEFLDYADLMQRTKQQLEDVKIFNNEELQEAPPCLQYLCITGFPQGTRNKGLFNLAVFAKQKYGDHWKEKTEQFNQKFMSPALFSEEVQRTIKSADRKAYFYTCSDDPIARVCNKAICLTRKYGIGNAADDLGVLLSHLTKIDTTPPTWIIAVNGMRIELEDTETLQNQTAFHKICIERLNIWPNRIKQPAWATIVKNLLAHVEIIDAPEDASPVGQLLDLVEEFCLTKAQARTRDEILIGKPYKEEGYTHFRSIDLMRFLSQRRFKEIDKANKVWSILRERGALNKVFSVAGKSIRVWSIPSHAEHKLELKPLDVKEKEEF